MSLADGQQTTGTDFLSSAGLVLVVKNTCWYFWDNPTHKYPFGEELDTPSIVEKMSSNTCQIREGEDKHDYWSQKLPFIRFALNTAKCETAGQTAASLNFGRELRTPSEVVNDIQVVIQNDNFVPEITAYLKHFAKFSTQIREVVEQQQDGRKFYADKKRKAAPTYQPGGYVFVASHPLSNAAQGRSAKLMPRRDGPYVILTRRSPSSYEIASLDNPGEPLGVYHTSALAP
ncbi:integrase catalytic domain-containing protein [Trichonephila clavipes]|nr:integrase catalytic domain-containing protein [Trichonephila clavipes]